MFYIEIPNFKDQNRKVYRTDIKLLFLFLILLHFYLLQNKVMALENDVVFWLETMNPMLSYSRAAKIRKDFDSQFLYICLHGTWFYSYIFS